MYMKKEGGMRPHTVGNHVGTECAAVEALRPIFKFEALKIIPTKMKIVTNVHGS
jgi:hypothetical protein